MTGAELYTLNQGLLSGQVIDEDMFYQFLNMKKDILEMSRDWMILRAFDSSITFTASDSYTSTKTLPDRFLRVYAPFSDSDKQQTGVYLVDSAGNKTPFNPIPFAKRFDYKDTEGYFYLDIKNGKIGRTGAIAGTLHLFFLQGTADIAATGTWVFPTFAHPLLAFYVAETQKSGIDWDTTNANQAPYNRQSFKEIESQLTFWDSNLQKMELGV